MKILVVDVDNLAIELVKSKLKDLGHQIDEERSKNNAIDRVASEEYSLVCLDPAPLTTPRPTILHVRRQVKQYPYILLMSESLSVEEARKSGCNDFISKPIDVDDFLLKIKNAEFFTELVKRIGDDSEDFPSAGGIIAKSAFNQLFLSAIDRADRYGEKTYVLFIAIQNYNDILQIDGAYAAEYTSARLSQYLVNLRRQSDIIGQTGKNEYALILQRPLHENEPLEAAKRFAEAIDKFTDIALENKSNTEIAISLVEIPTGQIVTQYQVQH